MNHRNEYIELERNRNDGEESSLLQLQVKGVLSVACKLVFVLVVFVSDCLFCF